MCSVGVLRTRHKVNTQVGHYSFIGSKTAFSLEVAHAGTVRPTVGFWLYAASSVNAGVVSSILWVANGSKCRHCGTFQNQCWFAIVSELGGWGVVENNDLSVES